MRLIFISWRQRSTRAPIPRCGRFHLISILNDNHHFGRIPGACLTLQGVSRNRLHWPAPPPFVTGSYKSELLLCLMQATEATQSAQFYRRIRIDIRLEMSHWDSRILTVIISNHGIRNEKSYFFFVIYQKILVLLYSWIRVRHIDRICQKFSLYISLN